MTTDFNELADTYHQTKENLLKRYSEEPTFMAAIGDLSGLDVLDLACGDGHFTRMFKRAGANRVVGVDIAENMIAGALAAESAEPLGIEYAVHDVASLPASLGEYDIVAATYLFHYAPNAAALGAMAQSIAGRLRPNGRLVVVGMSPALTAEHLQPLDKYGALISAQTPLGDGDAITVTIDTPVGPINFSCFHWTWAAYRDAFGTAGLGKIEEYPMFVGDEGVAKYGAEFWAEYLANPALAVFVAQRP